MCLDCWALELLEHLKIQSHMLLRDGFRTIMWISLEVLLAYVKVFNLPIYFFIVMYFVCRGLYWGGVFIVSGIVCSS